MPYDNSVSCCKKPYDEMLRLAALVDPEARDWIAAVSRVNDVLSDRPPRP